MNLKKYNIENNRDYLQKFASINVSKGGIFRFNKRAIHDLHVVPGIKVNLLQDSEHPEDWYIELTTEESGMPVGLKSGNQLTFCNATAAREIYNSLNIKNRKSVTIPLAAEKIDSKYYAL